MNNLDPIAVEQQDVAYLLNLANDMRKRKGHEKLIDLPISTPQDSSHCIIANAFNYGCSVEPESAEITFETIGDCQTYAHVMGFSVHEDIEESMYEDYPNELVYVWVEPNVGLEYRMYDEYTAPMTNQLVRIAEEFDNHQSFLKYNQYRITEDEVDGEADGWAIYGN